MAYKEKRYGKKELKILTGIVLAVAIISLFLGISACIDMTHWAKWIILAVSIVVALALGVWGIVLIIIVCSTHDEKQSVRDGNEAKGTANANLCEACGRVIEKDAEHCEYCGAKQEAIATKVCKECGHKNKGTAKYCKKCGQELE